MRDSIIFETSSGKVEKAGDPLKKYIISRIESGEFKPGMPLLSTEKLSHRFGISLITAQKVLKELGDEKFLIRQRGKRTVVADRNTIKEQQVKQEAAGVLFSGIDDNPFHAMLLSALYDYGFKHNTRIISKTSYSSEIKTTDVEDFIAELKDNGITHCIQNPQIIRDHRNLWAKMQRSGIKTVMLNDFWYGGGPFPCVRTHEEYGHEMIFEHLFELGHRQIMLLDEIRTVPRLYAEQAFKQLSVNKGFELKDSNLRYISDDRPSNRIFYSEALIDDIIENFTAVYCTYDIYAIRLIERLKERGIKVGKDISIAGFDDVPKAKQNNLTTIAHPIEKLVSKAFELLFSEEEETMCICLPPELIKRSSTGKCFSC